MQDWGDMSAADTKAVFRKYDVRGSGLIKTEALISVLTFCGGDFSADELSTLIVEMDPNHSGIVAYDDFVDNIYATALRSLPDSNLASSSQIQPPFLDNAAEAALWLEKILDGALHLRSAPKFLLDNADFMRSAVEVFGPLLVSASARLQDDTALVRIAVASRGWSLQFASQRLRDYGEVVILAVRGDGRNLRFASDRLRRDEPFAIRAVTIDAVALEFVLPPHGSSSGVLAAAASAEMNSGMFKKEYR